MVQMHLKQTEVYPQNKPLTDTTPIQTWTKQGPKSNPTPTNYECSEWLVFCGQISNWNTWPPKADGVEGSCSGDENAGRRFVVSPTQKD